MTASVDRPGADPGIDLSPRPTARWRDAFASISGYGPRRQRRLAELLDRIHLPAAYASVSIGGRIVATGLGVAENDHAGLFEMATDPAHRRRGLAARVRDGLMEWMADRDVTTAYLQVLKGNRPAERLYGAAGFEARYEYWYRIEPGSSTDRPPVA
jgi:GNAT superfamily N-acetyltransferase